MSAHLCKVKVKFSLEQAVKAQRYSSTLSLTSAPDGGVWSTSRPSCFTPEKETRYPLCRRLGGPQGRSGRVRKMSPPPGFDPWTVQPVASHRCEVRRLIMGCVSPPLCFATVVLHHHCVSPPLCFTTIASYTFMMCLIKGKETFIPCLNSF